MKTPKNPAMVGGGPDNTNTNTARAASANANTNTAGDGCAERVRSAVAGGAQTAPRNQLNSLYIANFAGRRRSRIPHKR